MPLQVPVSIERYLLAGEIVLVNSSGGFMPADGTPILETVESDNLHWDERFDDERITISRWPKGKHWYLSSTQVGCCLSKVALSRIGLTTARATLSGEGEEGSDRASADRLGSRNRPGQILVWEFFGRLRRVNSALTMPTAIPSPRACGQGEAAGDRAGLRLPC